MNHAIFSIFALALLVSALLSGCAQNVRSDDVENAPAAAQSVQPTDGAVAVDLSIARHDAPSAVRVHLVPNDEPRSVQVGPDDVLCLSLQRRGDATVLRVGAQAPRVQPATDLLLAGPGVEPGTYRTTPWQVLARLPTSTDTIGGTTLSAATFPRCPAASLVSPVQGRNAGPSGA